MVPISGSGDAGELGFCRSPTLVGEEGDGSMELGSPLEGETSSVAPMELGWPLEEEAASFVASMELESSSEGEASSAVSMELLLDVSLVVSMEPGLPSKGKTSSAASSVAAGVVRPPMSVSWGAAIERKETLACKDRFLFSSSPMECEMGGRWVDSGDSGRDLLYTVCSHS